MKKGNTVVLILPAVAILAVAAVLWLAVPVHSVKAAGDPIVVIVNTANPVDNLTMGDLKKLFMSDRSRWDTGKAVAPVMVTAGSPERTAFLKTVCGMNDAEFSKYFLAAAFSGKSATPPKEVGSTASVKKAPDFHGDGSDGGVKSVKVDGAAAADAGYKLRM
jgi:ABC-type phosphate transport system substrate-binding protein